jgi:hypothetical protein
LQRGHRDGSEKRVRSLNRNPHTPQVGGKISNRCRGATDRAMCSRSLMSTRFGSRYRAANSSSVQARSAKSARISCRRVCSTGTVPSLQPLAVSITEHWSTGFHRPAPIDWSTHNVTSSRLLTLAREAVTGRVWGTPVPREPGADSRGRCAVARCYSAAATIRSGPGPLAGCRRFPDRGAHLGAFRYIIRRQFPGHHDRRGLSRELIHIRSGLAPMPLGPLLLYHWTNFRGRGQVEVRSFAH